MRAETSSGVSQSTAVDSAEVPSVPGEGSKVLSEWLGHHDPSFILRTYAHLMPNSEARTRAVNRRRRPWPT
ncbi:hypothetical protein PV350_42305 [Streptomyces sp. PA03-6a]|nr:hypothetical protein [Streptomyces sp. PA03-6a]